MKGDEIIEVARLPVFNYWGSRRPLHEQARGVSPSMKGDEIIEVARLPVFETGTYGLEGRCSILLSYRRTLKYTCFALPFQLRTLGKSGKSLKYGQFPQAGLPMLDNARTLIHPRVVRPTRTALRTEKARPVKTLRARVNTKKGADLHHYLIAKRANRGYP